MEAIQLYNSNGDEIDLESLGLSHSQLAIPSPSYSREVEKMEGQDGEVTISKTLNPRQIVALFKLKRDSYEELLMARDVLNGILGDGNSFYVAEAHLPGKRWRVQTDGWERIRVNPWTSRLEMPLIAERGVSESLQRTRRKFQTNLFRFENEGTATINMRWQNDTELVFRGTYTNLLIHNKTTGDVWQYNHQAVAPEEIILKGVRSLKVVNGLTSSIFGKTNKKLIGFVPGWNEMEILGADPGFEFEVLTRFYFL